MYGGGSGRGGTQMGFGPPFTPLIIKQLIIANVVVFGLQMLPMTRGVVEQFGLLIPARFWGSQHFWEAFTYMWMHFGPMHILFNMFGLWMFGSPLAMAWGEKRFLRYYLTCGVGAGVVIATVPYLLDANTTIPVLGASGAVMGVLLAYSFTWPDRQIMLIFPPIPIKAIYLIPLLLFIEFAQPYSNVSHAGHLGGVVIGWLYLVQEGKTPGAPTLESLKLRWRRYQMRQKLRAVRDDEWRERRSWRDDDDRRLH